MSAAWARHAMCESAFSQPIWDSIWCTPFGLAQSTAVVCTTVSEGTAVAQWLRHCATNWKVAGSILDGVIGIFH